MSPDAETAHTRGYADGFHRRPPRIPSHPDTREIYLAAYRLGATRGAPKESQQP